MKLLAAALVVLFAILQYDLWVGEGSMTSAWRLQRSVEKQQTENLRLNERNTTLSAEVQDLKKGHDAIEERARHNLGMIKKDETFVQIVESPQD